MRERNNYTGKFQAQLKVRLIALDICLKLDHLIHIIIIIMLFQLHTIETLNPRENEKRKPDNVFDISEMYSAA